MSNRLFQTTLHQMKEVIARTTGVIDENGIIIACSEISKIGESRQRIRDEMSYTSDYIVYEGYTYRYINSTDKNGGICFVEGVDSYAMSMSELLAIFLGNMKSLYDEKYDKGSFIKSIILDNILPSDIYIKSNELHFNNDEHRIVIVVKAQNSVGKPAYEIIQEIVSDSDKDYVINISEQDVVIVKEIARGTETEEIENYCRSIIDAALASHGLKALVGVSSVVDNLKDLARAYKEARIAFEVGKVFDIEKPVISYENLGIGRLIYQLPTTLCEIFLSEVFKKGSLESLDRETLMTVQSFFENNLNVSETSRKLFVHRNTLVYRLEKIRKLSGLDLREFDHAVTFKVALMVKKYLSNKPTKY